MTSGGKMDFRKEAEKIASIFGDLAEWDEEVIWAVELTIKEAYWKGQAEGMKFGYSLE